LEQAYRYLGELGPIDEAAAVIGRDGAKRLASAGRRAFARGDMHAAANLLDRATALLSNEEDRAAVLPELAEALVGLGDFDRAIRVLSDAKVIASRNGNQKVVSAASLVEFLIALYRGGAGREEMLAQVKSLIPALEALSADNELASAWRVVVLAHGIAGNYELSSQAAERAIHHARKVGNERLIARIGGTLAVNALLGPTTVTEAIAQCEAVLSGGMRDRQVEAIVRLKLAQLLAMNERLAEARQMYKWSRAALRELGETVNAASASMDVALVELLGGDLALAERELLADYRFLEQSGETYYLSTMAALLAKLTRDQGRLDEALAWSERAEAASAEDDVDSQALWRSVRAPILARNGALDEAEALARRACELVQGMEAPMLRADAFAELAAVFMIARRRDEAKAAARQALELYEAKGDLVSTSRLRNWLSNLDPE
jgi:tetratricopeptide (TPR) repeat protein